MNALALAFMIYAVVFSLFTFFSILVLQSQINALDRELDTIAEEIIKMKKEMDRK